MKATELLQKQHREIEQLLERLRTAGPENEGAIREELASLLVAHTQIEVKHFYPALRAAAPDRVLESIEEHGLADYELARDLGVRAGNEQAHARGAVLAELVLAHIQKEESDLFRLAEEHLTNQELAEIGEVMLRSFEHVRRSNYRQILGRSLAENAPRLGRARLGKETSARRASAKKGTKAATPRRRATTTAKRPSAKRGTAKRGTSQRGTVKRGTSQRGTVKRGTSQRGTVKRGTAQRGTARKAQAGRATSKRSAQSARGTSQRGTTGHRKATKAGGSVRAPQKSRGAGARGRSAR